MQLDDATKQKADQLALKFFTKFSLLVDDARSNAQGAAAEGGKPDKWFNLETTDTGVFKDHLEAYRSVSSLSTQVLLPLELQVVLTVPELAPNQVLTYRPPGKSREWVDPPGGVGQVRNVLLERWSCKFLPPPPSSSSSSSVSDASSTTSTSTTSTSTAAQEAVSVPLATVYKHAMSTFRSLYTLLQVLPSSRVARRLRRAGGNGLGVSVRLSGETTGRVLGFGEPLSQRGMTLQTQAFDFAPVPHPMGMLALSVSYLPAPQYFELDSREALLSSGFFSDNSTNTNSGAQKPELDVPFTPTLTRNREAQSQTQSANLRALGAARSPPRNVPAGNGNNPRRGFGGFFENAPASGSSSASGGAAGAGASGTSLTGIVDRFAPPPTRGGGEARTTTGAALAATGAVQRSHSAGATSTEVSVAVVGPGEASIGPGSTGSLSSREEASGGGLSRVRKASSTSGGRDLPFSPTPSSLPARRPSINAINPFRSSTLVTAGSPSSSASLRQAGSSPLAGPSLPSARGLTFPTMGGSPGQSSSGIAAFRTPSSPGFKSPLAAPIPTPSSLKNSPPFAQGDRLTALSTSPGSASASSVSGSSHHAVAAPGVPVRRRYSSQLSHRYDREKAGGGGGGGGAGSEGASSGGSASASAGSAVEKARMAREGKNQPSTSREKVSTTASFLSSDDDLSLFVQDIDSRKPLGGGSGSRSRSEEGVGIGNVITGSPLSASPNKGNNRESLPPSEYARRRERTTSDISGSPGRYALSGGLSSSPGRRGLHFERTLSEVSEREREPTSPTDVPANADAIDERLRRMNEAFRASLTGLTRRGSGSSSPSPASGTPGRSSGDEAAKSPAPAVEESPTTPLAPLARAGPPEGRERTSALSRYMRMASSPAGGSGPSTEPSEGSSTTTAPPLASTNSEGVTSYGHHRSSTAAAALQTRRTRSDFDSPPGVGAAAESESGEGEGADRDRQRRALTQLPTRIRVVNVSRSSAATPVSNGSSSSNSNSNSDHSNNNRRVSSERWRADRDRSGLGGNAS